MSTSGSGTNDVATDERAVAGSRTTDSYSAYRSDAQSSDATAPASGHPASVADCLTAAYARHTPLSACEK
jgi:hypothetical protein